jgi:hypothetical protein
MVKKQEVNSEEWDNLIVLDACRYDHFQRIYRDYFDDESILKFEKRKSKGSATGEWLYKTFGESYNYRYFSAIPHVNSKGISLSKTHSEWEYDWKAVDHFEEIIDVWDSGWEENLDTVPPEALNNAFTSNSKTDNLRNIIHYVQPHRPYIYLKTNYNGIRNGKKYVEGEKNSSEGESQYKDVLLGHIGSLIELVSSRETKWKLREYLGMKAQGIEHAWRNKGIEHYYEENLKLALEQVSELVTELEGKTVITADHGEFLGEYDKWGKHPYETNKPELREVPWLEIK